MVRVRVWVVRLGLRVVRERVGVVSASWYSWARVRAFSLPPPSVKRTRTADGACGLHSTSST